MSEPVDHEKLLREAMAGSSSAGKAAHRVLEPEELAPHFPDFEILGEIGRGGMGAVYKAVQKRLSRVVAIKVLPRELAASPEFGERFLREARALASLNHPHVLTVHDFGEVDGLHYLVTELVDGVNLRELMSLGELSPAEALRITPQICRALQYAHEHGIVHRDVKPENILIDTAGQVKIADFGLAKLARPGDPVALTRSTEVFGTPHYMAPEQWRGSAAVDHRADIYSLGVVLYEMLTGHLPIGSFDPPSSRQGVPPGLDEVVRRTLAQRPENRYQSAREVETDVELRGRTPAVQGSRHHPGAAHGQPAWLVALLTIVLVLAGLVVLAGSLYLMLGADPSRPLAVIVPLVAPLGLLVSGVGFWSIHRLRRTPGEVHGIGLAATAAWLPILLLANLVVVARLDRLESQLASLLYVSVLLALDVVFLVSRTRYEHARRDPTTRTIEPAEPAATARTSGWSVLGIVLTVFLVLMFGCVGSWLFLGTTGP